MPGQRSARSPHVSVRLLGDDEVLFRFRCPQLRQRELEQGEPAACLRCALHQLVDDPLRAESYPLGACRGLHRLPEPLLGERPQEVQRGPQPVPQHRKRRETTQEVAPGRRENPHAVTRGRKPVQGGGARRCLRGFAQGDQLLELVDEHDEPSRGREAGPHEPPEPPRVLPDHSLERVDVSTERTAQGDGEAAARRGSGYEGGVLPDPLSPEPTLDAWQQAGPAQGGLADPGVPCDHDETLRSQPLQHVARLRVASEVQTRAVGVEGSEPWIGVALGDRLDARFRGKLRQGASDLVAGSKADGRVRVQAPVHHRCECRVHTMRLVQAFGRARRGERARAQLVKQDAQRVHVGPERRWRAPPDFRRHVGRRPHDEAHPGQWRGPFGDVDAWCFTGDRARRRFRGRDRQGGGRVLRRLRMRAPLAGVEQLGDPEVEQLCFALGGGHHVRGLDVPMQYTSLVCCGQGSSDVHPDAQHTLPGHRLWQVVEALPIDELRHQVGHAFHMAHAIDRNDIGVLESCDGPGLDEKAFAGRGVRIGRGDDLDGDAAIEKGVYREEDFPHPSAPDRSHDAIPIELGGRGPGDHVSGLCNPRSMRCCPCSTARLWTQGPRTRFRPACLAR